jgi:hypothetical protein
MMPAEERKACEIAGLEPRYELSNGETDLLAFVVSQNVKRRELACSALSRLLGEFAEKSADGIAPA